MSPLTTQATEYAEDLAPECGDATTIRRAFMAGALAALTSKATREQMLAECVQFGRAIGTAAEAAKA